jgi:hypothetical protein
MRILPALMSLLFYRGESGWEREREREREREMDGQTERKKVSVK